MNDKIYLINDDDQLTHVEVTPPIDEREIQNLLSNYPDFIPGYQLDADDPRRWMLVQAEVGIPDEPAAGERWSLDHLFLDQDGTPTLVEVKKASNYQIRREVVGQLLDYAANAVSHWEPQDIRRRFEATCHGRNKRPEDVLAELLQSSADDESRFEDFWQTVYDKLEGGKLRLVFVADEIPKPLARIIEFMDLHMSDIEVVGVALPQYKPQLGPRLIVPKVVGRTALTEQKKVRTQGRKWDEESFFADIVQRNGQVTADIARRIFDWSNERNLTLWWGEGKSDGSFIPILILKDGRQQLFGVWTYGRFEFQFQYYRRVPFSEEAKRLEFLQRLNHIEGVDLRESEIAKRPSVELGTFEAKDRLAQLLSCYDWFIDEVVKASE